MRFQHYNKFKEPQVDVLKTHPYIVYMIFAISKAGNYFLTLQCVQGVSIILSKRRLPTMRRARTRAPLEEGRS